MSSYRPQARDRLPALIVTGVLQAALLWALIAGLAVSVRQGVSEDLALFSVPPPKPPPPVQKVEKRPNPSHRPEGAASPPNLRSRATEIVAPKVEIIFPPPVVTAPAPSIGMDASTGYADIAGPGTGAGGVGNGTGSGDGGDGDGAGGDETPPRWIGGRMSDRDFPDALRETTNGGVVGVRYTVLTTGRVGNCRITRSSGVPLLDQTTCRLITQRFRFRPSRDAAGRPVDSEIVENHEWVNEMTAADFEEPPPQRRRRGW
ncbi:energy transducer TonB [Sphingomonas donggukensis]|uniref:Energy transducer TonB n=1 Tax=Sphingomonas donggukensis TaxID=2949093 RepID=A0ABY4TST3_9SPHN|nr:energy transducer TonB [Sphingomonas donggukensis]URW75465.1 energy transducer TonB [Sphingomonas donggukensis]